MVTEPLVGAVKENQTPFPKPPTQEGDGSPDEVASDVDRVCAYGNDRIGMAESYRTTKIKKKINDSQTKAHRKQRQISKDWNRIVSNDSQMKTHRYQD